MAPKSPETTPQLPQLPVDPTNEGESSADSAGDFLKGLEERKDIIGKKEFLKGLERDDLDFEQELQKRKIRFSVERKADAPETPEELFKNKGLEEQALSAQAAIEKGELPPGMIAHLDKGAFSEEEIERQLPLQLRRPDVVQEVVNLRYRLLSNQTTLQEVFKDAFAGNLLERGKKQQPKLVALKELGVYLLNQKPTDRTERRVAEMMVQTAEMASIRSRLEVAGRKTWSVKKGGLKNSEPNRLFKMFQGLSQHDGYPESHKQELLETAAKIAEVYGKKEQADLVRNPEALKAAREEQRLLRQERLQKQQTVSQEAAQAAEKPPVAAEALPFNPAESFSVDTTQVDQLAAAEAQRQASVPESIGQREGNGREQAQAKHYINQLKDGGGLREPYREQVKTLIQEALFQRGIADEAHRTYADKMEEQLRYAKFRSEQVTPGSAWNIPLRFRQLKHWFFEDFVTRADALGASGWFQGGKERLRSMRAETVVAMREKAESILQRGDASSQEREKAYFLHGLADEYDLLTQNELYVERGYRETEGQLTGGVMGKVGRALRGAWKALKWLFGGGKRERQKLVQGRPAVGADVARFLAEQQAGRSQAEQAPTILPMEKKQPSWTDEYVEPFQDLFEAQQELLTQDKWGKGQLEKLLNRQDRAEDRLWKEMERRGLTGKELEKQRKKPLRSIADNKTQLLKASKEWDISDEYLVKEMTSYMEARNSRYQELLGLYGIEQPAEEGPAPDQTQAA